jgi:hypothetical protein
MLQMFGRGLGGMLGTEMRSPQAQQQAQLQQQVSNIKDPSSYEGMVQLAQAVMNIDPIQGAQLLAKAEEQRKASELEQLNIGNEEIQQGLQRTRNEALARSLRQKGFEGLATQVIAGDEEARKKGINIISESSTRASDSTGVKAGTWKDKDGNFYIATRVLDKATGATRLEYSPVGDAPEYKDQKLTIVNAEGLTAQEDVTLSVTEAANKKFIETKLGAADNISELANSRESVDAAIGLLDTVETGGPLNIAGTAIERFLGEIPADKAELELLLGEQMYTRLKPLFGGVISEGEREAIEQIYGNLKKGNAANRAILGRLKEELDKAYRKSKIVLNAENYDSYINSVNRFYPDEGEQQKSTVNWNDL